MNPFSDSSTPATSANVFNLAAQQLLTAQGIAVDDLSAVLAQMSVHQIDYADIYLQFSRSESLMLEEGIVKEGSYSIEQGAGLRAISGEKTGFAYSDTINLAALQSAATTVRCIAQAGQGRIVAIPSVCQAQPRLYLPEDPLGSLTLAQKINLLQQLDTQARQADARVREVSVNLGGSYKIILVVATDGTLAADVRPLVRLSVNVVVEQHGRREQGGAGGGGRFDYQTFLADDAAFASGYVQEAVRRALVNLEAVAAPAGNMTVVLGAGWPGVLLHEAVGHGLEGDFNRKGTSAFTGRMGKAVASSLCTIVDDGTLPQRRGSLSIDDEGTPTQTTVLIEKGILRGYMQDKLNARLMGTAPTGNGRRESYADIPLPRMTNTYMQAGDEPPEDIIASVKKGLYAVNFGGGEVDITSGKFVFSATEAYLIEEGKITQPVKGATLIGNGIEVLTQVSRVGNDLRLDTGVGSCGKNGQTVPVGVGQPTLRVEALTVGGTHQIHSVTP